MKKNATALFIVLTVVIHAKAQPVTIKEEGNIVTLANGLLDVSFNKNNADLTAIHNKKGTSLLGKQGRGYLLGPGFSMSPAQFKIVRKTNDLIEVSFFHDASNHFQYDLHYILRSGVSGVYCFLVQSHRAGDSTGTYGQTRWGIRADESLFDYHLVRDSIQGPMPKMADLKDDVQDWTFKLDDGTIYTKYDYADYIEGRHVHGMAGQQSGLGLYVIQASHEYLNGGPTKQYQNVHATPFLICMFNCGHFLSDIRKSDDHISGDWTKLDGPFLLYANEAKNTDESWKDAKQQATKEIAQWPYSWMQNKNYPLERGTVKGKLMVNGKPALNGTHIILAEPGYDWQAQCSDYIFYTTTNSAGEFVLPQVRAGIYTLYAYGSNQTEEFRQEGINVDPTSVKDLGTINWKPISHGEKLWQIGIADRTTKGFKLSNHKRNYSVFTTVPADLTFTVGHSKEDTGWYYAQTQPGEWKILFDVNKSYSGNATLTLAIAGAAKNPTLDVSVNGNSAASFKLGNDASVYRSAILGGYYQLKTVSFPASLLKTGTNTIVLALPGLKPGGGIMYDAIKLEAGETKVETSAQINYTLDKLVFSDDFKTPLDTTVWKAEIAPQPNSIVYAKNKKLVLDTKGGVTVWLNQILNGNFLISYKRKIPIETGPNDRLSDLNNFWMASDPRNVNLFTRHGVLEEYDSLQLYYVGMGGNSNRTTRFRKYLGNGQLPLLQEYTDGDHLLQPNKEYTISIITKDGATQFLVDDKPFFTYTDPQPLKTGYFGFRSTKSRQEISDFKIYSIK